MIEPEAFKAEIEAFISKNGIAPTRFGKEAVGDPKFVFDLRQGREPSWRTAERVKAFMSQFGACSQPEHQGSAA
ncbi:hypothetical protein [Xanthobacter versatilis]|uniref:hypothetical protein n=1 Tax=Xanthobacter autotrophicus (strain ATCC BAA-1158 / Py2) TaxID=78245 RepID=UPI00372BF405